jgi:5'-deoxynucleotidase YfbR-like HD superfamily hydrolase
MFRRIEDIAHGLAHTCRFNGHFKFFYSVAEHSMDVADHLSDEQKLLGLLHDASEAYLADLPRPIKPHLSNYRRLEAAIMAAVADRFELNQVMPALSADTAILTDEAFALMTGDYGGTVTLKGLFHS